MSKTTYLVGDDGGAIKTNSRRAVEFLKTQGYSECSRDEYLKRIADLEEAEKREFPQGEKSNKA